MALHNTHRPTAAEKREREANRLARLEAEDRIIGAMPLEDYLELVKAGHLPGYGDGIRENVVTPATADDLGWYAAKHARLSA